MVASNLGRFQPDGHRIGSYLLASRDLLLLHRVPAPNLDLANLLGGRDTSPQIQHVETGSQLQRVGALVIARFRPVRRVCDRLEVHLAACRMQMGPLALSTPAEKIPMCLVHLRHVGVYRTIARHVPNLDPSLIAQGSYKIAVGNIVV